MSDARQAHADLEAHRIIGYAQALADRGLPADIDVPLISHIDGNLWMGGHLDGVTLPDDFRWIVSLYPWGRYPLTDRYRQRRIEFKLYDSSEVPAEHLHEIADDAYGCTNDGKTLVHCQAGLNRSGLIAALVLMRKGHSAQAAVDLLREKRSPAVLCNWYFERWLLGLDDEQARAA